MKLLQISKHKSHRACFNAHQGKRNGKFSKRQSEVTIEDKNKDAFEHIFQESSTFHTQIKEVSMAGTRQCGHL